MKTHLPVLGDCRVPEGRAAELRCSGRRRVHGFPPPSRRLHGFIALRRVQRLRSIAQQVPRRLPRPSVAAFVEHPAATGHARLLPRVGVRPLTRTHRRDGPARSGCAPACRALRSMALPPSPFARNVHAGCAVIVRAHGASGGPNDITRDYAQASCLFVRGVPRPAARQPRARVIRVMSPGRQRIHALADVPRSGRGVDRRPARAARRASRLRALRGLPLRKGDRGGARVRRRRFGEVPTARR